MKFTSSILFSILCIVACYLFNMFNGMQKVAETDNFLPPAQDAVVRKFENTNKNKPVGSARYASGSALDGFDKNSAFYQQLRDVELGQIITRYGYVSPDTLYAKGEILGQVNLTRPDGYRGPATVIRYKGRIYDADVGFPCYLSGFAYEKLGLRMPWF